MPLQLWPSVACSRKPFSYRLAGTTSFENSQDATSRAATPSKPLPLLEVVILTVHFCPFREQTPSGAGDVVSRSQRRESVRASDTPSSHICGRCGARLVCCRVPAATAGRPRHKISCRHCPSPRRHRTYPPGFTRAKWRHAGTSVIGRFRTVTTEELCLVTG